MSPSWSNPSTPTTLFKYEGFIYYAANADLYLTPNSVNAIRLQAEMGANTIDLNWNIFQSTSSSNILNDYSWEGSNSGLGAAIDYAHSLGLKVALKPTDAILDGSGAGVFVQPRDVASWFVSYKQEILKYATLAQQHHVELFTIGTEFIHLDRQPEYLPYWTDLIAAVRQVYSGQITYAAAVPNVSLADPNYKPWLPDKITFWKQLDYVGLDLYPTLTTTAPTSVAQVANGWQSDAFGNNWIAYLNSLNTQFGKPVMLTELGFPSYPTGYVLPPAPVPLGAVPDQIQQELLYAGTYQALTSNNVNLAGITQWVEAAYPPDASAAPDMNSPTGFGVFGKPAQFVLSSWWGAKDYLAASESSFTGGLTNDRIALFGDQINSALQSANGGLVSEQQTFSTTISVTVSGNIINNRTPTLHIYANGVDYGQLAIVATPNGYVDPAGVSWTTDQSFSISLLGLVQVSQIKIAFDSPVNIGGAEASSAYISGVSVNGTTLSHATYFPLSGSPGSELIDGHNPDGTGSQFNGGYTLIDAAPWNTQLAADNIGTPANPIQVNGGGGTDTAFVLGPLSDYTITQSSGVIHLRESAGLNQNANLTAVAQVQFSDYTLVFDLNSSEDLLVYKLYQAAYNRVPDNAGFRFWAAYADPTNASAVTLADFFLAAPEFTQKYGTNPTNLQYVTELYSNVLGRTPDQAGLNFWVNVANSGYARDLLLVDFATSAENVQLIGSHTSNGLWTTH